jgi:hypothetical protein
MEAVIEVKGGARQLSALSQVGGQESPFDDEIRVVESDFDACAARFHGHDGRSMQNERRGNLAQQLNELGSDDQGTSRWGQAINALEN